MRILTLREANRIVERRRKPSFMHNENLIQIHRVRRLLQKSRCRNNGSVKQEGNRNSKAAKQSPLEACRLAANPQDGSIRSLKAKIGDEGQWSVCPGLGGYGVDIAIGVGLGRLPREPI